MRLAALLILLIGHAAGEVPTQPTSKPFAISSDPAGQLYPQVVDACNDFGVGSTWSQRDDGTWEYERSNPGGYFDGRVSLKFGGGRVEVSGWRYAYQAWTVTSVSLVQTDRLTVVEYTIRTPAGMPDWTIRGEAKHTAELMADAGIREMVGEVLAALGGKPYDDGPYLSAIRNKRNAPGWVSVKVDSAIDLLASRSPRLREMGEEEIRSYGWEAAAYLRQIDQSKLSVEQRRAVQCLLSEYPFAAGAANQ